MAYFIVKHGNPDVPSSDWLTATDATGLELRWTNGAEAAAFAKALNDGYRERGENNRAAVKRETEADASVDWQERARERFTSGHWQETPWSEAYWTYAAGNKHSPDRFHFAHVAKGDATKVAFYASLEDGTADRLTVITPGRYLARFFGLSSPYPVLSEAQIGAYAAEMGADANDTELHFATTPDEFEDVYTNGPSSCMSNCADDYESSEHPVRVYAAGDLQLAYLTRDDRIIARVLCWPENLVYGRIYGDDIRLRSKLKPLGYTRGSLEGARMLKIKDGDGYIAPYLDDSGRARDDGDFLVIDSGGPIGCCRTDGLTDMPFVCPHCGEACDRDETIYVAGNTREYWCSNCAENDAFYCDDCGHTFANGDRTQHEVTTRRRGWSNRTYDNTHAVCGDCFEHNNYVHVANRDEYWNSDATFQCEACGEHFVTDDEHGAHPNHCSSCGESLDLGVSPPSHTTDDPSQLGLALTA